MRVRAAWVPRISANCRWAVSAISSPPANPTPSNDTYRDHVRGSVTFPRIAIVRFAHSPNVAVTHGTTNGVEMLRPCFDKLYAQLGITRTDIEFWCSGSSDTLPAGLSFISAVDSIGAMPPINESHVEMDAVGAVRGMGQDRHR